MTVTDTVVAVSVATTVACGMAAFDGSVTVPTMRPALSWAPAGRAGTSVASPKASARRHPGQRDWADVDIRSSGRQAVRIRIGPIQMMTMTERYTPAAGASQMPF